MSWLRSWARRFLSCGWRGWPFCWIAVAACHPPNVPEHPTVSLRISGAPNDAEVVIDEEPLGTFDFVAQHGVALPPGVHRVTVRARGFFPWDRIVEAQAGGGPIRLPVVLVAIPD